MEERATGRFVHDRRGVAAPPALVGFALLALAARTAAGAPDPQKSDLQRRCATVQAFEYDPTPKELKDALARAGSQGRTRLDLHLTHEPAPAPPEASSADDGPTGGRPTLPLPKWKKPADAARTIAAAKTMAGVRELVLDRFPLTVETARILAVSKYLGGLESLSLERSDVTAAALQELLAPASLPALAELNLTNNRMKAAELEALAQSLAERKLRRLRIGVRRDYVPIDQTKRYLAHDGAALAALAHLAAAPGLAVLDLAEESVSLPALQALLGVERKQPLEVEIDTLPRLDDKQLAALAALNPEGQVTLAIADAGSKAATLRALDKSGLLAKVSALHVACGDACARIIAGSAHTARLRKLGFGCEEDVPFTKATAVALATATNLPALRDLSLYNEVELCKAAGIGAAGLRALLAAPLAGRLERLALEDQNLNGEAFVTLAKAASLGALKELYVVEEDPILTAANVGLFFRDGALARHLEVLSLQNESDSGWPLAELAKGLKMPKLRSLELPNAHGSLSEWLTVARAPGWGQVRALSLYAEIEGEQGGDQLLAELRARLAPDACVNIGG